MDGEPDSIEHAVVRLQHLGLSTSSIDILHRQDLEYVGEQGL
jgi:hypothetical protein